MGFGLYLHHFGRLCQLVWGESRTFAAENQLTTKMKKIILFGLMALLMVACSSSDDGLEPSLVPPAPATADGTKTDSAKTDTAKTEPETVKFAAKYRVAKMTITTDGG